MPGRPAAAYADTLDTKQVAAAAVPEHVGERLHLAREVRAGVDGRVPLAAASADRSLSRSPMPVLDVREQVGAGAARGGRG